MAVKRGKSQARRNNSSRGGLPGWAWLILGIVIAVVAFLGAPKLFKSDGSDGFIRPRANPDAQPAAARSEDDAVDLPAPMDGAPPKKPGAASSQAQDDQERQYDFYTLLPGQEVAMSDAELAASARAEAARQRQSGQQPAVPVAAANPAVVTPTPTASTPTPIATTPVANAPPSVTPGATPSPAANTGNQARYILQAGAFGASGDAEAVKAKIALLGLNARVESAAINGKTVYRVRMGPYGTATELATAKGKLANGGLPAMAIKAK